MYRCIVAIIVCANFAFVSSFSMANELPTPPKGYSWVQAKETKSAYLKPDGWYFRKERKGSTWAYFISKENIDKTGRFYTGVTVNIIPNIPKTKGKRPSEFSREFIQQAMKKGNITNSWKNAQAIFKIFGYRTENKDDKNGAYLTHNLLFANDTTGTLYFIVFEAPTTSWGSDWGIAETILNFLAIDTEI